MLPVERAARENVFMAKMNEPAKELRVTLVVQPAVSINGEPVQIQVRALD